MNLYRLRSEALRGFYQSHFYVVAESDEQARQKIRKAFDARLMDPENMYSYDTIPDDGWVTDGEARENRLRYMRQLEEDLARLELIPVGVCIEVSS